MHQRYGYVYYSPYADIPKDPKYYGSFKADLYDMDRKLQGDFDESVPSAPGWISYRGPVELVKDDYLGVDLYLNQEVFHPGDPFVLKAFLRNQGPDTYEDLPFALVLEIADVYFWFPGWTTYYSKYPLEMGIEYRELDILKFTWSDLDSHVGFAFYSAFLSRDLTALVGLWDGAVGGWKYP